MTVRPQPWGGACENTTTGRPAAAASLPLNQAICSSSMNTSCALQGRKAHSVPQAQPQPREGKDKLLVIVPCTLAEGLARRGAGHAKQ